MSFDASSHTYQIMPEMKSKAKSYVIEISLSDTFAGENLYWFTVKILPKDDQLPLTSQGPSVAIANAGSP